MDGVNDSVFVQKTMDLYRLVLVIPWNLENHESPSTIIPLP